MRRLWALLAACAVASPALAADPLKSPVCGDALAALEIARVDSGLPPARLEALRSTATRDCLGGPGDAVRPAPVAQAPIVVPPPVIAPPTPAAPAPAPPPLAVDRPPVITQCDSGGCWDSSGTRLNSTGTLLIGPGGACTTAGTVVRCP